MHLQCCRSDFKSRYRGASTATDTLSAQLNIKNRIKEMFQHIWWKFRWSFSVGTLEGRRFSRQISILFFNRPLEPNSFMCHQFLQSKVQHRSLTWSWVQKACPQATGGELLAQVEGRIDVERALLNGEIHQPVRTRKHISHYSTLLHCDSPQGNVWRDATAHGVRPGTGFLYAEQFAFLTMLGCVF